MNLGRAAKEAARAATDRRRRAKLRLVSVSGQLPQAELHLLQQLAASCDLPEEAIRGHAAGWTRARLRARSTGEEHAVALAVELKAPILLDEKEARRVARMKGLLVLGTIGLLERGRQKAWSIFRRHSRPFRKRTCGYIPL